MRWRCEQAHVFGGQEGEEKCTGGKQPELRRLQSETWGWLRLEMTVGTSWEQESTKRLGAKIGSRENGRTKCTFQSN